LRSCAIELFRTLDYAADDTTGTHSHRERLTDHQRKIDRLVDGRYREFKDKRLRHSLLPGKLNDSSLRKGIQGRIASRLPHAGNEEESGEQD
jgi:hypothetical protein